LGVILILFGGYGFVNGQSTVRVINHFPEINVMYYQLIPVNFTVCFLSAGATAIIIFYFVNKDIILRNNRFGIQYYCNCFLMSMAAISASVAVIKVGAAFFIGVTSTLLYTLAISRFTNNKIDPCKSIIVHGLGGIWGLLCAGFFADQSYVLGYYGYGEHYGWLVGGGFTQLLYQALGIALILIWTLGCVWIPMFLIKCINPGLLRVDHATETNGLDSIEFKEVDKSVVLWQVREQDNCIVAQFGQFKIED